MPGLPLTIAADHPALAGHFPGRPIVPGVVLLDQAILLIESVGGRSVRRIAQAKFLSPVGPGEALDVDYSITDASVRFEIRAGERKVANGRLELA